MEQQFLDYIDQFGRRSHLLNHRNRSHYLSECDHASIMCLPFLGVQLTVKYKKAQYSRSR